MKRLAFFGIIFSAVLSFAQDYNRDSATDDMFRAIASGDTYGLRQAIQDGADLNARCRIDERENLCYNQELEPETPWVKYASHPPYLAGCTGNSYGEEEEYHPALVSPLFLATALNKPEIIELLLQNGARFSEESDVCVEVCEGGCWMQPVSMDVFGALTFKRNVSDDNLRTAKLLFEKGYFGNRGGDFDISLVDIIRNRRVSDEVLAEFIQALRSYEQLDLAQLEYDGRKVKTILDIAIEKRLDRTVAVLKSMKAKRVKSTQVIGRCTGEPNCSGTIIGIRFTDGSKKKEEFCECGT